MKRYLVAAGVGTLVFGGVLGSASALNVGSAAVAEYGQTGSLSCDDNVTIASYGVDLNQEPAPPSVSHYVRVTGIDGACSGHQLWATALSGGEVIARGGVASPVTMDDSGEATVRWDGGPIPLSQIEEVGLTME